MSDDGKIAITWDRLIEVEPLLSELYKEIRKIRRHSGKSKFCANAVWYGYGDRVSLRERLSSLVGWDSHHPLLRSSEAYDLAYEKLYSALPDCEHDGFC